jgi:hypothetical protein
LTCKGCSRLKYLQFLDELFKIAFGSLFSHDVEHLSANGTNLTRLGIASRLGLLVSLLLGEPNAEETKVVSISCADINKGFNERLPLSDQGAKFITGHVHSVEVGEDIKSVNIFTDELDLAVSLAFITTVEISEGDFENTSFQTLRSDLYSSFIKGEKRRE